MSTLTHNLAPAENCGIRPQKPRRIRPSLRQRYHRWTGTQYGWWIKLPDWHRYADYLCPAADYLLHCRDVEGNALEIHLGECRGSEVEIAWSDSPTGKARLIVLGRTRFDIKSADGRIEHFKFADGGETLCYYRLASDICTVRLNRKRKIQITFASDGCFEVFDDKSISQSSSGKQWEKQLSDGSHIVADGNHYLEYQTISGFREFLFLPGDSRWMELVAPGHGWSFGAILNAENSNSTEVLGLVTLYGEDGSVELWHTKSFPRFSEIEETLVDAEGNCQLYVTRAAGSDDLLLFEDGANEPTGICRFAENYFVGKDGETLYNAWLYAASYTAIPLGIRGTNPLGTLLLLLLVMIGIAGAVWSTAAAIAVALISVLVLSVTARDFAKHFWRLFESC